MTKRISAADLPAKYQGQVAAQLYKGSAGVGGPCKFLLSPKLKALLSKADPCPVARPLRQSAGGLNKLEQAFLGHLPADSIHSTVLTQAITLKIANGCRYTPDFVLTGGAPNDPLTPPCWWGTLLRAYEVKGFMRDDAAVKLKVAASLYPWIAFHLVTRKKGVWQITPVLP